MHTVFIALGALLRLVPHVPNFTPIGALALFGAAYGSRRSAIFVPLAALAISDLFIGGHPTIPYVYGSFVLIALLGMVVFRNGVTRTRAVTASVAASAIFFLVSNFGHWLAGTMYPRTFEGLLTCYAMALPFLRGTMIGDLFYVGILFGGYALARRFATFRRPVTALVTTGN